METTQETIKRIASFFNIDANGSLFLNNKFIFKYDESNLQQCNEFLNNLIYKKFYAGIPDSPEDNAEAAQEEQENFYSELLNAYNPAPFFDKGWVMIDKEINGTAYLQKKQSIIKAAAGQYVFEFDATSGAYKHSNYVNTLVPPMVNDMNSYFYYVAGSTPDFGNDSPILRFYFNLNYDGAPELIKQLTHWFNLFHVPFNFKCCQNIIDYNRSFNFAVNAFWMGGYQSECHWYPKLMAALSAPTLPLITTLLQIIFTTLALGIKLRLAEDLQPAAPPIAEPPVIATHPGAPT